MDANNRREASWKMVGRSCEFRPHSFLLRFIRVHSRRFAVQFCDSFFFQHAVLPAGLHRPLAVCGRTVPAGLRRPFAVCV